MAIESGKDGSKDGGGPSQQPAGSSSEPGTASTYACDPSGGNRGGDDDDAKNANAAAGADASEGNPAASEAVPMDVDRAPVGGGTGSSSVPASVTTRDVQNKKDPSGDGGMGPRKSTAGASAASAQPVRAIVLPTTTITTTGVSAPSADPGVDHRAGASTSAGNEVLQAGPGEAKAHAPQAGQAQMHPPNALAPTQPLHLQQQLQSSASQQPSVSFRASQVPAAVVPARANTGLPATTLSAQEMATAPACTVPLPNVNKKPGGAGPAAAAPVPVGIATNPSGTVSAAKSPPPDQSPSSTLSKPQQQTKTETDASQPKQKKARRPSPTNVLPSSSVSVPATDTNKPPKSQRTVLVETYAPHIQPTDTSLEDARLRLRTALDQTRYLRAAFTDRIYDKYRIILKPVQPSVEDIVSRTDADPEAALREIYAELRQVKDEKDMEKKDGHKLNAAAAAGGHGAGGGGGVGGGMGGSNDAETAEQLAWHGAGLSLVILPEVPVDDDEMDMGPYEHRGPIDPETGHRVSGISTAAAAAAEALLDRVRRGNVLRMERKRRRELLGSDGGGGGGGDGMGGNDAVSPMHLFPSAGVGGGAGTGSRTQRGGKASKQRASAKGGSSADGGAAAGKGAGRMKSHPSGAVLLSVSPSAEGVDEAGRPSAATAALVACGVGKNASTLRGRAAAAQQNRWKHPHPDSVAGRKLSAIAGGSQSSRRYSGALADPLVLSPPLDVKARKKVKPSNILPREGVMKPAAARAIETVLGQFLAHPLPPILSVGGESTDDNTDLESKPMPSGKDKDADSDALGSSTMSSEPTGATCMAGDDKPSKDDADNESPRRERKVTEIGLLRGMKSLSDGKIREGTASESSAADIDPMLAFSVLHALGVIQEASSTVRVDDVGKDSTKPAAAAGKSTAPAANTSPLSLGPHSASNDEIEASKTEFVLRKRTFSELFASELTDCRGDDLGVCTQNSEQKCSDVEMQPTDKQEGLFESTYVPHIRGGGTVGSTDDASEEIVPGEEAKASKTTRTSDKKESSSAKVEEDKPQTAQSAPSDKSDPSSMNKTAVPAPSALENATPRPDSAAPVSSTSQSVISPSMMTRVTGTPIPNSQSPFSHQQMLQMQQSQGGDSLLWGEQGVGMRTNLTSPHSQAVPGMMPPPVMSSSLDGTLAMHQASISAAARLQGQQYQASAAAAHLHHAAAASHPMHTMAHGSLQQNTAATLRHTSDLTDYFGNTIQHSQHPVGAVGGYAIPPEWASLQATGLIQPHSFLSVANMGISPHAMVSLSAQDRAARDLLVREQHAAAVAAHAHAQAAAAHRHAAATARGMTGMTGITPLSPQQAAAFGASAYSQMGAHMAAAPAGLLASPASSAIMARQQQHAVSSMPQSTQAQAALNVSLLQQNAGSPGRPLSVGAVSTGTHRPSSIGSRMEFPAIAVLAPDGSVVRPSTAPAVGTDGMHKSEKSHQGVVDMTKTVDEMDTSDGLPKDKTESSSSKSVSDATKTAASVEAADEKGLSNPSGVDACAVSGTAGMRFFVPPPPKGLSQEVATLILQSCFHNAIATSANGEGMKRGKHHFSDSNEDTPLVEYLLAVGAAVPIPKALITNLLKEKLTVSAFKGTGSSGGSLTIPREVVTAAIVTWLWAQHKDSFQRAFAISGRIDVDPECKWLIHAAVDTSTRALVSDWVDSGSSLSPRMMEVRVAKIVSQSLMKELCIDKETDIVLANLDHLVQYLDDRRLEALKAKSQERALLAALVSRRAKMSESFSHAYTSAMVRAGEAFGHEDICDIVQDEFAQASTMLPFDFFDDEVGAWEDPCRPATGFVAGLSGEELMWRAHGRAMIQKSLKKLQDRYGIKGGTSDAGPYKEPPSSKGDSSGGTGSSSSMRSPPISRTSSGLKRKASFSSSSDAAGNLTSAAAAAKSALFNPIHYSSPLIWDCDDIENMPYGRHDLIGRGRARSLSMAHFGRSGSGRDLAVGGGRKKRARRSTSSTRSSPATPSPKASDYGDKKGGIFRSTREIDWSDVASMFHQVDLPGVPSSSASTSASAHAVIITKKGAKIIAPFCEEFDYSTLDGERDTDESDTEEEDLSDERVLARHQEVLDDMKQKLEHVMAMRQQLQERTRKR